MTVTNEDIEAIIALGFDTDNNNAPAPENILDLSSNQETSNGQDGSTDNALCNGQSWGWSGFHDRITNIFQNSHPRMKGMFAEVIGATMSTTNGYVLLL